MAQICRWQAEALRRTPWRCGKSSLAGLASGEGSTELGLATVTYALLTSPLRSSIPQRLKGPPSSARDGADECQRCSLRGREGRGTSRRVGSSIGKFACAWSPLPPIDARYQPSRRAQQLPRLNPLNYPYRIGQSHRDVFLHRPR